MNNQSLSIKIDHVSKKYKLGAIGGTTLREELQRKMAIRRHKEDPTLKIGVDASKFGEEFLALDDVSFEVKKGEAVGIIGHNGAGKSTLLKLITRVTGPTSGKIGLNGRITSMLEVGTGFHGELTGRENIYMNGAILGMTKKEIDERIEDIIDFSEVRQFIDTPVKRYSSGMYVKLAFSVAAHLNSEIMIMDEVLAVGDMAFQKKCIEKMRNASTTEGRTVLYVSHNMNTIRQLCDRCIVLDHGHVVFDGDVEDAIHIYTGVSNSLPSLTNTFGSERSSKYILTEGIRVQQLNILNKDFPVFRTGEPLDLAATICSEINIDQLSVRFSVLNESMQVVGMGKTAPIISIRKGFNCFNLTLNIDAFSPGKYSLKMVVYEISETGSTLNHDVVDNACFFEKEQEDNLTWHSNLWGDVALPTIKVIKTN